MSEAACFEARTASSTSACRRRLFVGFGGRGCCRWQQGGISSRLQLGLGFGGAGAAGCQPQRRPPRRMEDGFGCLGLAAVGQPWASSLFRGSLPQLFWHVHSAPPSEGLAGPGR